MDKQWLEAVSKLEPLVALEKEKQKRSEELKSVLDTDRNFSVIMEEKWEGFDIILKKDGKKDINLSSFLFPWYTFVESDKFYAYSLDKKVRFVKDEIDNKTFLLSLFHEIWHTHNIIDKYFVRREDVRRAKIQGLLRWVYNLFKYRTFLFLEKGKGMPKWYIKKRWNSKAIDERDAWAFAIREMRYLQSQWYNVWHPDSLEFVKICLHSHERGFVSNHLETWLWIDDEDKNVFVRDFWDEIDKKSENIKNENEI